MSADRSPFATALEALRAPLEFASRCDGASRRRIRDLGGTLRNAASQLTALRIPQELRRELVWLAKAFAETAPAATEASRLSAAQRRLTPFFAADWRDRALARPLQTLPGVGPQRAQLLAKRGLVCVADLLLCFPQRYEDRRATTPIAELQVGQRAHFVAEVEAVSTAPGRGGRRVLRATVGDGSASVVLTWLYGSDTLQDFVQRGRRLFVSGEVRRRRFDPVLFHPEIEVLHKGRETEELARLCGIVPHYGVPDSIPGRTFRRYITRVVAEYADLLPCYVPEAEGADPPLPPIGAALDAIHNPPPGADCAALLDRSDPPFRRLILEELLLLQLGLRLRRAARRRETGIAIEIGDDLLPRVERELPFTLTGDQRSACREIYSDLRQSVPMNRLLQGDVGSGKTAVAFLAARAAAAAGYQSALMAPTELLAEQHERTLRRYTRGAPLRIALLTASLSSREAAARRRGLIVGDYDLVVGTHALLQDQVAFPNLALAIIDEQHRFGVLQRAALAAKTREGREPHVLVMTATPIPRTLALTLHGELDISSIRELPAGRRPLRTLLLRDGEGGRVVEEIRAVLARGEQAYVVYPLVEASEKVDLRAVEDSARRIARTFPEARVGLAHGRLEAAERLATMDRFEKGQIDLLVCTTVIEVGVDVPNATLIVIEHAERFGLAQLHQLRGRVGRGRRQGTCLVMARASTAESEARLAALLSTQDGFAIADADLRIRGPGEFLGTRQSGYLADLRIANLARDTDAIAEAGRLANRLMARDPELRGQSELRAAVTQRWGQQLSLIGVG